MAMPPEIRFCACCETPAPVAPADVFNRPGLTAIGFRIGTFATFREAMLEAIARQPELTGLATRESDDYAITLLELFAAVGDVLTFYNERSANEFYLRTARERDSVLRLVRLIGYQLRPGLAATAMLAFTLDTGAITRIRKGLKVMSTPGQDEKPQIFEALAEIVADARLNALPVWAPPTPFNAFHQGSTIAPLASRPEPLAARDRFVLFGLGIIEEKAVTALTRKADGERLAFAPGVQNQLLWPGVARAAKVLRRLRFFGHNAPASYQFYDTNPAVPPQNRWNTAAINGAFDAFTSVYPLDARYEDLKPGAQLLVDAGAGSTPRLRTAVVATVEEGPESLGNASDTVTRVRLRQTLRGTPAALVRADGGLLFAARSGAGSVLVMNPAVESGWKVRTGLVASEDPAAVSIDATHMDVFVRDAVGHLQGASWTPDTWGAWSDFGGVLTSRPAPLALAGGRVVVFARGLNMGLWVTQTSPALIAWLPIGGVLTSDPVPVTWGGNRVDVFVRGPDRGLWRIAWNGAAWSAWEPLGGTLAGAPAAASTAVNRLDVVALDDDGALIHRRWTGTAWTAWRNLGGKAQDRPAIVATGSDRIDVFVRGEDDQLWQITRSGEVWTPWISLAGTLSSAPAVVARAGAVLVGVRDADGAMAGRLQLASGWGVWVPLGDGLGAIADRRQTRIYELASPDIVFREYDYPPRARNGRIAARLELAPGLDRIDKNRRILIKAEDVIHQATVTATTVAASAPGDAPDHLLIDFTPPLPRPLAEPVLYGNIAEASHGETQPEETLGNGDATRPFQRFRLSRAPVTYLPSAADIRGRAELELRVNGALWQEVPSLYARRPTERVYTLRQTDEGESEITFGDGRTGARLPTGAANVIARYRKGLGLEGRVQADQLSIPLERPVGLRAVTNPLPADGGADAETRDDAREAAPTTVRTFGRAVSLQDFEWLATSSGLLARAHATWVWSKLEKAVFLTVAAAEGAPLSPASLDTLYAALTAARDPNRPLMLANLVRVPVVVQAKIIGDPTLEADAVLAAAQAALLDHFAFETMPLGRAVHASEVYSVLQGAEGVVAVDLDLFHLKGYADLTATERDIRAVTTLPVQTHIRIFPARPTPVDPTLIDRYAKQAFADTLVPPPVLPAEQAYIEDAAADVTLTMVEAL